jgi:hypothetical protein
MYIFNRENPQNSEPQNGLRRGFDFIALLTCMQFKHSLSFSLQFDDILEFGWQEVNQGTRNLIQKNVS